MTFWLSRTINSSAQKNIAIGGERQTGAGNLTSTIWAIASRDHPHVISTRGIDMDSFYLAPYSSASLRRRSFHRLGVAIAGAIIAVGLAMIGAAISRLDLF